MHACRSTLEDPTPDTRTHASTCFVLKQPLPQFKTAEEWLVDIDRTLVERDALLLLADLLPQNSVPQVLWFDEQNYILALSAAPADAKIWKSLLLQGHTSNDAATHAGMLLAIMHSSTLDEPHLLARYGPPKFFTQQRIDPYFHFTARKHPTLAPQIHAVAQKLLSHQRCLIHGDFSPKNIFVVPELPDHPSSLLILDFEVAFYSHPAFDVATLLNHLTLKAFHLPNHWRNFLLMASTFLDTYSHTADKSLTHLVNRDTPHLLASLLLARVDGKSPAEYITDESTKSRIRQTATALFSEKSPTLESTLDTLSTHLQS